MSKMDYFRRPLLAGVNIPRTPYATIRGSIRRSDADGNSPLPYFPNCAIGQTLSLEVDGGPTDVTLDDITLAGVINRINTDVPEVLASDADGCLQLMSRTPGGVGSVEVTGGNAALGLGFNTLSASRYYAVGGDIPSAPEGRRLNPFGAATVGSEDLSSDSVNRAFARVMANMDVLFSEHIREDVTLSKVGDVTGNAIAGTNKFNYVSVAGGTRVYTGLGLLSSLSNKNDLAPYFVLFHKDNAAPGGQVAPSRIVAVVRGVPQAAPTMATGPLFNPVASYADTASWAAQDGGNVLGLDLDKVTGTITDIQNGSLLKVNVDVIAAGVKVGDYAFIDGATNLSPFSNNGYRWVVESIKSVDSVILRPMSKTELTLVGSNVTDSQPVVELNPKTGPALVFGSVTFRTGPYMDGVNLVVSPPVPAGTTYELWAAQPRPLRERTISEITQSTMSAVRRLASSTTQFEVGFLATPSVLASDPGFPNCVVLPQNTARWYDGRFVPVPAAGLPYADFQDGVSYIYWDIETATYQIIVDPTSAVPGMLGSNPSGLPVAKVTKSGPSTFVVEAIGKALGEATPARSITVGARGMFDTLAKALAWVNATTLLANNGSNGSLSSSTEPHWDITLLSKQTLTESLEVKAPGIKIRAFNPQTVIEVGDFATPVFKKSVTGNFYLEDIQFTYTGTNKPSALVDVTNAASPGSSLSGSVFMRRVMSGDAGTGPNTLSNYSTAVLTATTSGGGTVKWDRAVFTDCLMSGWSAFINGRVDDVLVENCTIKSNLTTDEAGQQQIFRPAGANAAEWTYGPVKVYNTVFTGWGSNASATHGAVINTTSATLANATVFRDCLFTWAAVTATNPAFVLGIAMLDRVRFTNLYPVAVKGTNSTTVKDCHLLTKCDTGTAVLGGNVTNTYVYNDNGNYNSGIIINSLGGSVSGCSVSGYAATGIRLDSASSTLQPSASSNSVYMYRVGGSPLPTTYGIRAVMAGASYGFAITGNKITVEASAGHCINTTGDGSITNNVMFVSGATSRINGITCQKYSGSNVGTVSITGNVYRNTATGSLMISGISIVSAMSASIVGNQFFMPILQCYGITTGGGALLTVTDNWIWAEQIFVYLDATTYVIATGNLLRGNLNLTINNIGTYTTDRAIYSGNIFQANTPATTNFILTGDTEAINNHFLGGVKVLTHNTSLPTSPATKLILTGNRVEGALTIEEGEAIAPTKGSAIISGNVLGGGNIICTTGKELDRLEFSNNFVDNLSQMVLRALSTLMVCGNTSQYNYVASPNSFSIGSDTVSDGTAKVADNTFNAGVNLSGEGSASAISFDNNVVRAGSVVLQGTNGDSTKFVLTGNYVVEDLNIYLADRISVTGGFYQSVKTSNFNVNTVPTTAMFNAAIFANVDFSGGATLDAVSGLVTFSGCYLGGCNIKGAGCLVSFTGCTCPPEAANSAFIVGKLTTADDAPKAVSFGNCQFQRSNIAVSGARDFSMTGCTVTASNVANTVALSGISNGRIYANNIYTYAGNAIIVGAYSNIIPASTNVVISGNVLRSGYNDPASSPVVYVAYGVGVRVSTNIIEKVKGDIYITFGQTDGSGVDKCSVGPNTLIGTPGMSPKVLDYSDVGWTPVPTWTADGVSDTEGELPDPEVNVGDVYLVGLHLLYKAIHWSSGQMSGYDWSTSPADITQPPDGALGKIGTTWYRAHDGNNPPTTKFFTVDSGDPPYGTKVVTEAVSVHDGSHYITNL